MYSIRLLSNDYKCNYKRPLLYYQQTKGNRDMLGALGINIIRKGWHKSLHDQSMGNAHFSLGRKRRWSGPGTQPPFNMLGAKSSCSSST